MLNLHCLLCLVSSISNIQYYSALFSMVQDYSRELKTSCRQPIPQCLKSILDRRRQRVFNSRSCRWVPSTILSTSITSTIHHFFCRKQLFCGATECLHSLNSTILAGESETIKHSFSKLILHNWFHQSSYIHNLWANSFLQLCSSERDSGCSTPVQCKS